MNEADCNSESDSQANPESTTDRLVEEYPSFPIVGIGASAGGLQAFKQLLSALPTDTGMGFVLIQHLDRSHKSLLAELLSRTTQMQVKEVEEEGAIVEPNRVYIIPPNKNMVISQGKLQLSPRSNTLGKYMPIDIFLESLAADIGNKAVGVVLSGMDGDGTLGVEAIKAAGGITFAQTEQSAQYQSMPHMAITGGSVDFILSPEDIARELAKISRHPYVTDLKSTLTDELLPDRQNELQQIFQLLLQATGANFTDYKQSTLKRRLMRRLMLHNFSNLEDYVKYLQQNPDEVIALYQDFLINVTYFFREPEAFEVLKQQIFPRLIVNRTFDNPIRIWVVGCSTGEEAYSIAICLLEFLEENLSRLPIKILATDISDSAIDKARSGTYIESDIANVSEERLRRFFVKIEGGYKIIKQIRDLCVFAKQNVSQDPPFSKLDLISCRNMLIYLGTTLQKKVIPLFHYALKPTGFLMLGTAETIGGFSELFALVDKKYKIYSRKLAPVHLPFDLADRNLPIPIDKRSTLSSSSYRVAEWNSLDVQKKADSIVLSKYAPVGAVVNQELEIIQFRGQTSLYFQPAPGQASLNILKMVRENLLLDLRTLLLQAKEQNIALRKEGISVKFDEQYRKVNIEVSPFQSPKGESYFLVLFENATPRDTPSKVTEKGSSQAKKTKRQSELSALERQQTLDLRQELAATKEYLQSIIEEQEITNEEFKATNEELLSSNEEFQSTNEELETAKEEIQATNEELKTINEELQYRNQEITHINNDLNNLLGSVNIAIVMFGLDLSVRLVTSKAKAVVNVSPADIGRSLADIQPSINVPNLPALIAETIDTATPKELEVQDFFGHWYNLRLLPYKTMDNKIEGAVMVLGDIDALKKINFALRAARNYAEAIVDTVRQPLLVLDSQWRVKTANQSFYNTFQVTPEETEQQVIFDLGNGQWALPSLRLMMGEIITKDSPLHDFEVNHEFTKIGYKTMLLNACKIPHDGSPVQLVLVAIEDISDRKQLEQQSQQLLIDEQAAREASEAANNAKEEFISILAHELRNPLSAILGWSQILRNRFLDPIKTQKALETIERSAKLQSKLIEDLLDLSRINAGKLQLNLHPVNFISIVEAAMNVAILSAEDKNVQLELFIVDPDIPKVMGDSDRLHQVTWNLLTNAIKFTPDGGQITIRIDRIDNCAQMQVCDNGIGITPDFLPYVFDRYRQADYASKMSNVGLGLGLALVRYLVELHGGTVEVFSAGENQGTTFTVKLPLIIPDPNPPFPPTPRTLD